MVAKARRSYCNSISICATTKFSFKKEWPNAFLTMFRAVALASAHCRVAGVCCGDTGSRWGLEDTSDRM